MNRREFIAGAGFLGGASILAWQLSSGASSSLDPEDATEFSVLGSDPTETPTSSSTVTAAETETETPGPAETETEQPTPTEPETEELTDRELRARRQLSRAERDLTNVVETFTGEYGTELTDVKASSTEFKDARRDLQIALAEAQQEYTKSSDYAANASQRTTAELMEACWQFLRQTAETQTQVVNAYEHLENARTAFEQVEPGQSDTAISAFQVDRRRADTRYQTLSSESTAEAASVIEAITVEEYNDKLAQFDADVTMYYDLDDPLSTFAEGVRLLKQAQGYMYNDNRHVSRAKERARDAKGELYDAQVAIKDLQNDAGDDATLTPMLGSLRLVAKAKIDEAEKIMNRYE